MKKITLSSLLILCAFVSNISWSADFDKGLKAYYSEEYSAAINEWRPLAEKGNLFAQYRLANMYRGGKGVKQDYDIAMEWYKLAAEQGHINSQFNLANGYDLGKGVPQDSAAALKWFTLAAEQGDSEAQFATCLIF